MTYSFVLPFIFLHIGYCVWNELHVRRHSTFINYIYRTTIGYKASLDLSVTEL
jgi:hypothetical protein